MLCESCIVVLCRLIWYENIFYQPNLDSYSVYDIIDEPGVLNFNAVEFINILLVIFVAI